MAGNWQRPGVNHVGEYQASGHVLVVAQQSGNQTVNLSYVAKAITFTNSHGSASQFVKLYDNGGASSKDFYVGPGQTVKIDGKFLKFFVDGDNISAVVELTNIPSGSYTQPTWGILGTIT